jgi:pyruvate,water dikinase
MVKNFLNFFKKEQKEDTKDILRNKYVTFQSLLNTNNEVLEQMADLEDKLSGEYLFDRHYVHTTGQKISDGVFRLVEGINALADNKYLRLNDVYHGIKQKIDDLIVHKIDTGSTELVIPVSNISKDILNSVGGKMAIIGEMRQRLGLPTPDGFAVTSHSFKHFMAHNNFSERINNCLHSIDISRATVMEDIRKAGRDIREMIVGGDIPDDLKNAVSGALNLLKTHHRDSGLAYDPSPLRVSVRSSAIFEDGESSFAGQYATFLNVSADLVIDKYKEVLASLFTERAIFYYKTKGFSEDELIMAVGVLTMIDAESGGVAYTRDPNFPEDDALIINGVWGLGKPVVDGTETPHAFKVSRDAGAIIDKKIPDQKNMILPSDEGGIRSVDIAAAKRNMPCLSDTQLVSFSRTLTAIENHFGSAQDVEWAADSNGKIYFLQSRPLKLSPGSAQPPAPRKIHNHRVIVDRGTIACKGVGCGKAFILKDEEDLKNFPEGAVLVAKHTSTKFVTVMNKAAAIITDVGSVTGHMASLSREYGVPSILDTGDATQKVANGLEITVDAVYGNVYEGRVEELLRLAEKRRDPFKDTRIYYLLRKIADCIVPLNLTDPEGSDFTPEHCRTFHDLTRFVHEMAMAEMFEIREGREMGTMRSVPLFAGIPVDAHVIDIDGGLKPELKKALPEDVLSVPFAAFLKGMMSARWPEPRAADVKGFIGMIAHTATIQEEELRRTGERSFAVISGSYMNFSIRLGYHFSMVEAYAGENINDNYIKFFFTGGGAVADRRLRRVRLIKEIIKKMGFRVSIKNDVINAMLTKYRQPDMENILVVMGRLTAFTKQLDMAMYNDDVTDMFIEEFCREHLTWQV